MNSAIRQAILEKARIPEGRLNELEQRAASESQPVEKLLVMEGVLTRAELGQILSSTYLLPQTVITRAVVGSLAQVMSLECARKWKALPIVFDRERSLITFAVPAPEHAEKVQKIFAFMMEPYDLAFVVAPEFEIAQALSPQPDGAKSGGPSTAAAGPVQAATAPSQERQKLAIPTGRRFPIGQGEAARGRPSETELDRALFSAASVIVSLATGRNAKEFSRYRTRARHCQLLAARAMLPPRSTSAVTLAAWLSVLRDSPDLIRQLVLPYDVEGIIIPRKDKPPSPERLILSLVEFYQTLEDDSPSLARDVAHVRRHIQTRWPDYSKNSELVETFLQVLMDEQYVAKLGRPAGEILVVDSAAIVGSPFEGGLRRAGYVVHCVSSPDMAVDAVVHNPPDLILINASSQSSGDLVNLCRTIKQNPASSSIPCIAIVKPRADSEAADFLRAGADDAIMMPVDNDLLCLKIEKHAVASARADTKTGGVTGSLSDLSFSDLFQVLSASCRSVEISFRRGSEEGRIYMQQGNVVHAVVGDITGEQAFFRLMQWRDGQFSLKECSEFPEQTISASTMSLLMEGARLADEGSEPQQGQTQEA